MIDTTSGDVLASASMPSFDPNSFSDGISHLEYEMLNNDEHLPLRNKTLQGLYPPGSTVKPMVGLALLNQGVDPEATVGCSGSIRVGNAIFHCWKRGGHGAINLHRAIEQSCDVYFYHMAQQIGMDPDRRDGAQARHGPALCPALPQPELRHGARHGLENEEIRQGLGSL